jgi:hypothetical protein
MEAAPTIPGATISQRVVTHQFIWKNAIHSLEHSYLSMARLPLVLVLGLGVLAVAQVGK